MWDRQLSPRLASSCLNIQSTRSREIQRCTGMQSNSDNYTDTQIVCLYPYLVDTLYDASPDSDK